MKIVGIIAEYNPFHKGHEYQIQKIKHDLHADYIIIAMSGNFLQRGAPALCDKYTRTEMALRGGADLVLELPTLWATASAEYFAQGGVQLLANTGVVTHLAFGTETTDLNGLLQISSILKKEPDIYRVVLGNSLRTGNSFPTARKNALITSLPKMSPNTLSEILDAPNNILALEYLKALPDNISPMLIPRKGADYYSTNIHEELPSATAIRKLIFSKTNTSDASSESHCKDVVQAQDDKSEDITPIDKMQLIANAMPKESYQLLSAFMEKYDCIETNDFSSMLGYRLLSLYETDYSAFADCSKTLSNRIKNHLPEYVTFEDFTQILKSKDMTYTRISRCLLHILLNITQSNYQIGKAIGYAPYLRILGFKKESSELLTAIKKEATAPLITKAATASSILDYSTNKMFNLDLFASSIYYHCLVGKAHGTEKPITEFTHPIVIL